MNGYEENGSKIQMKDNKQEFTMRWPIIVYDEL